METLNIARLLQIILFINLLIHHIPAQFNKKLKVQNSNDKGNSNDSNNNVVAEMQVVCHSDSIELKMNTNTPFRGMVYAKDAPNNNNCVTEYNSSVNMTFKLPLKSCGTLFAEADDGIEYFNTVVVQPHMRLMTNQGKGYHIRCKYQTRERTIANTHFNVSASFLMQNNLQAMNAPILATASMPSCTMKIFRSGRDDVAEAVKIGDKLIMVIEIDQQDMYGMKITNCVVRNGQNTAEQLLINDAGCPVDENIMPKFEYSNNSTRAAVSFPAHKFPGTSSVYYQCNVRLCINNNGGCTDSDCSASPQSGLNGAPRKKRFVAGHHGDNKFQQQKEAPSEALPSPGALLANADKEAATMSFDVYSGLYVDDIDVGESGSSDKNAQQVLQPRQSLNNNLEPPTSELCLTLTQVTVMILMASFATMIIVLMLVCQVGFGGGGEASGEQQVSSASLGGILSPSRYSTARRYYRREFRNGSCSSNGSVGPQYVYDPETMSR